MNPSNEEKITYSAILKTLGVLAIFFLIVHSSSFLLLMLFKEKKAVQPIDRQIQQKPNVPLLEALPSKNLRELRKKESTILGSYGWVDRENEIIRIPIDRAMDLILENNELIPPSVTTNEEF